MEVAAARRILAVMAGLLAVYLVLLAGQRAMDGYRARQDVDAVRREIDQQKAKNLTLQTELRAEQQDHEIERVARGELGLVQPGDHPVVLIGPTAVPRDDLPSESSPRSPPNWRSWLRLFSGLD